MIERIKNKPWSFIFTLIYGLVYWWLIMYRDLSNWLMSGLMALVVLIYILVVFRSSYDREKLQSDLNDEIKRLNYSNAKLLSVTGYNRYEVTQSGDHYIFAISAKKQKQLLKFLKTLPADASQNINK